MERTTPQVKRKYLSTTDKERIMRSFCYVMEMSVWFNLPGAGIFQGLLPQPLYVAHRCDAEQAFVLPIEV